ncbi:hypothetical protein [Sulfurimonas sp.]|uniref:hypothetical protein n=1 Tax=Sulfurimonas sp. TaxID=2022749 RepID=UPI002AB0210C|nr:hypothetical protein [Sulfurimonas sp.]
MKFTKLSLVAMLLIGSSAFAIENIKVSGDTKFFYSTQDNTYDSSYTKNERAGLFDQSTSIGEASLSVGVTADLTKGVSAGATLSGITTLGLQNNLVGGTFTGNLQSNAWFNEAWLAGTTGKTTAKVGRMQLDTPLVFSETWSVLPSTFEAAVLINQDIPDTTIVAAFVGKSNSDAVLGGGYGDNGTDARNNVFQSFYKGAYTVGIQNNSWKPLEVQAWYYSVNTDSTATATQNISGLQSYWLQADLSMKGILAGVQYTSTNYDHTNKSDNNAFAVMLGYDKKDVVTVKGSYSQIGKDSVNSKGAGANLAGSQSKLYTEVWWYYGKITQNDTSAFNVTVTAPLAGYNLGLYYTQAITKDGFNSGAADATFVEVTFEVAKSFGPLDTGLYYIYIKSDNDNQKSATEKGEAYNTVQVYLTYNF